MKPTKLWLSTLCVALALVGCTQAKKAEQSSSQPAAESEKPDPNDNKRVRILATFDSQTPIVDTFAKKHPDKKVEWVKVTKEAMMESLTKEDSADLLIVDNGMIAGMNDIDAFVDVSQAPYQAHSLIAGTWFPGIPLEPYRSLNGKHLIAIPKDVPMNFTYYREDILKKYGFPAEPEALAKYLESPQNWLEMARKLKENNHWIFSYRSDPVYTVSLGKGFYGRDKRYLRNDEQLVQAVELARTVTEQNLAKNLNIWDDNGKNAIRKDEIVMLYIGEWAKFLLKDWDPEKAGLWKMTRLPMNQYVTQGGASFMIPKNSRNKLAAWEYVLHSQAEEAPYRDSLESKRWYSKLQPNWATPLDRKAAERWDKELLEMDNYNDMTSEEYLASVEERIRTALGKDLPVLFEAVK